MDESLSAVIANTHACGLRLSDHSDRQGKLPHPSRRGAARLSSSNVEALEARVVLTVTLESAQNPPAPPTGWEMEASPRPYWDGIYTGLHGRTIVPGVSLGADDVLNSHTTLTGSVPSTASATLGTQVLTYTLSDGVGGSQIGYFVVESTNSSPNDSYEY